MEEGLVKRFMDLEASQSKLREQLDLVMKEGTVREADEEDLTAAEAAAEAARKNINGGRRREYDVVIIPGYFVHNPYRTVLQHLGHALHVFRPDSGEIIYWNQSAENLFGWKEYEVLGQKVATLLIDERSHPCFQEIMEILRSGTTWSGQFPLRKRSEETFMAMVTQSPLYENGELIGVISVSSDGAVLNDMSPSRPKVYSRDAHGQQRDPKLNCRRANLRSQPTIASSVSNLALKTFPRSHAVANSKNVIEISQPCGCVLEEYVKSEKPSISALKAIIPWHAGLRAIEDYKYEETISKFNCQSRNATKMLYKFQIRGGSNDFKESDKGVQTTSVNNLETTYLEFSPDNCTDRSCSSSPRESLHNSDQAHDHMEENKSPGTKAAHCCALNLSDPQKLALQKSGRGSRIRAQWSDPGIYVGERRDEFCNEKQNYRTCLEQSGKDDARHELGKCIKGLSTKLDCTTVLDKKNIVKKVESATSAQANGSSLLVGREEPDFVADCDIRWEDLLLGEKIGQGSYAVVYRGAWNGSDVAVKVYLGNDYQENLLLDYQKEITIMKRLRHPNVLLFMGAVYSPDRLAIVTEYLPRGSLFLTLHKNGHKLDLKRRLRMALDVARGMNYLHRRKPPIIHRDLKSSNLLVDRNWSVKVGDFGLSCLKISTLLTATSGKGTPQWMAPEVLRGECTNEKSDVFSFGVILWELMTVAIPWCQLNPVQVIGVVGIQDRRLDLPENIDPRVSSIICDCWQSNPELRPAFQELVGRTTSLIKETTAPGAMAHRRSEHDV